MFFQSNGYCVDLVRHEDLNKVVEVYNSNSKFLVGHMDKEKVTEEWVLEEQKSMKEVGFYSCKIVENSSSKIIGVMDFKVGRETYLSLLMLHNDFRGKGFGKFIFQVFEEYVKKILKKGE